MNKRVVATLLAICAGALMTPAYAGHTTKKSSYAHSHPGHHYSNHEHYFSRKGHHEDYNPHHRNCGHMPGGSC